MRLQHCGAQALELPDAYSRPLRHDVSRSAAGRYALCLLRQPVDRPEHLPADPDGSGKS
jgi:hypothetical protein